MKRLSIIAAVIGALFIGAVLGRASATTTVTFDSVWWNGLDRTQQLAAVQGLIQGEDFGWEAGHYAGSSEAYGAGTYYDDALLEAYFTGERSRYLTTYYHFRVVPATKALRDRIWKKSLDVGKKKVAEDPNYSDGLEFSKTFGTYVDAITHYYENNPQSTTIPAYVMSCFADSPTSFCQKQR